MASNVIYEEIQAENSTQTLTHINDMNILQNNLENLIISSDLNYKSNNKQNSKECKSSECSSETEFVDIYSEFKNACGELKIAEMIHSNSFTLLGSMSAIELSDTKNFSTELPSDLLIESGLVKLCDFTQEEIITIIDKFLACFATWFQGHTLAQTVFICVYAQFIDKLDNPILQCYLTCMIKCTSLLKDAFKHAQVQEDEDAMDTPFDFNYLENRTSASIIRDLNNLIDEISNLATCTNTVIEEDSDFAKFSNDDCLFHRLKFSLYFLEILSNLEMFPDVKYLEKCKEIIIEASISLMAINKTHERALNIHTFKEWQNLGFDERSNFRLLPPIPRKADIINFESACTEIEEIFNDLLSVIRIVTTDNLTEILLEAKAFSSDWPIKHRPNIVARSYLKNMIFCNGKFFGYLDINEMIREEVKSFSDPPVLNIRSKLSQYQPAKLLCAEYITSLHNPLIEMLTLRCYSRARQYSRIQTHSLQIIAAALLDSESADYNLDAMAVKISCNDKHMGCFTSWILYNLIDTMLDFVLLGLEYKLYTVFEYHYVFWYIEYLLGCKQSCIDMTKGFLTAKIETTGKNKNKGHPGKKRMKRAQMLRFEVFEQEKSYINVLRLLCVGYMRAFEALILSSKLPEPNFEFTSKKTCFEQRFIAFAVVNTPKMLTYEKYEALFDFSSPNKHASVTNYFNTSSKHFQIAKAGIENLRILNEELEDLLKILKFNIVTMNLAASGHALKSTKAPEFDFTSHRYFPYIRLN